MGHAYMDVGFSDDIMSAVLGFRLIQTVEQMLQVALPFTLGGLLPQERRLVLLDSFLIRCSRISDSFINQRF